MSVIIFLCMSWFTLARYVNQTLSNAVESDLLFFDEGIHVVLYLTRLISGTRAPAHVALVKQKQNVRTQVLRQLPNTLVGIGAASGPWELQYPFLRALSVCH